MILLRSPGPRVATRVYRCVWPPASHSARTLNVYCSPGRSTGEVNTRSLPAPPVASFPPSHTFAAAGNSTYARYAAELAANESEHRLLGQTLAGANPPNDLGFAEYEFDRVSQIATAAQSAGFGFGEQGTAAGRFYDLPQSPMAPPVQITSNEPR